MEWYAVKILVHYSAPILYFKYIHITRKLLVIHSIFKHRNTQKK